MNIYDKRYYTKRFIVLSYERNSHLKYIYNVTLTLSHLKCIIRYKYSVLITTRKNKIITLIKTFRTLQASV